MPTNDALTGSELSSSEEIVDLFGGRFSNVLGGLLQGVFEPETYPATRAGHYIVGLRVNCDRLKRNIAALAAERVAVPALLPLRLAAAARCATRLAPRLMAEEREARP